MCIDLTVRMETSTRVADAANWGNIELARTKPAYRPLPHRCETHITSHSLFGGQPADEEEGQDE